MKLTVFKGQYGFSTIAKNGEDKMYIQVGFKKGQEPNLERARIDIKDGFFSMYKNKAGFAFPKLVVMDYEVMEETQNNTTQVNDYVPPFDDSDLPF